MIDLYFWATPNSQKVLIAIEELSLEYNIIPINIHKKEHLTEDYKKINPTHKLPAIIDHKTNEENALILYESNAILMYLADKKKMLLPKIKHSDRYNCLKWLSWQNSHFTHAILNKNIDEIKYNYMILEDHLKDKRFICGNDFSISDIAFYPWVNNYMSHQININQYPHTKEWYYRVFDRQAVKKAREIAKHFKKDSYISEESREFFMKNDPDKNKTS